MNWAFWHLYKSLFESKKEFVYIIVSGSPLVLKSPVLSHFKTDGHMAKIKSEGYKDATPNTTFFSPKKSDHALSLSPQQAFPLLFASLLFSITTAT